MPPDAACRPGDGPQPQPFPARPAYFPPARSWLDKTFGNTLSGGDRLISPKVFVGLLPALALDAQGGDRAGF